MKINLNTRIKALLDVDSDKVIEHLVQLNSNFSKLRNPVLRHLLARRITIVEACKIAGCNSQDFLKSMQEIGFTLDETPAESTALKSTVIDIDRKTTTLEFDVRPYLKRDKDPLKQILMLANRLEPGERLKIINSFEPVPLIHLLADKGFIYFNEVLKDDLIITWFEKTAKKRSSVKAIEIHDSDSCIAFESVLKRFEANKIKYLDVRHLEMPQPMLLILEQVEDLNSDELLYVFHKKTPVYLLEELQNKEMTFLLKHKSTHEVDILIYRL